MDVNAMKDRVIEAIDTHREEILAAAKTIWEHPELGYREHFATGVVSRYLENLDLPVESPIAVTGCSAYLESGTEGPTVALLGELDAIGVGDHPEADEHGLVHACGHHIQVAGMLGAVTGLAVSGILPSLAGRIKVMATPAEEYVEMDYRQDLKDSGAITFFGGKQELIKKGYFDDVDIAMMFHASGDLGEHTALTGLQSNGFIGKQVIFTGRASHAGSAPHEGVNALNAASLALININCLRETFAEKDRIRVHSVITKGGDIVNVVPADVRMEVCVRARTVQAMVEANQKVNRALKAGALAIGADITITDLPGYLPIRSHGALDELFTEEIARLGYPGSVIDGGDYTCSFDFGDVSQLMPTLHPMVGGVSGALHTKDFRMEDAEAAILLPAKAMAMTVIDLLCDDAKQAREILSSFTPAMTKESYLACLDGFSNQQRETNQNHQST